MRTGAIPRVGAAEAAAGRVDLNCDGTAATGDPEPATRAAEQPIAAVMDFRFMTGALPIGYRRM